MRKVTTEDLAKLASLHQSMKWKPGNCYEDAFKFMDRLSSQHGPTRRDVLGVPARLCHGIVASAENGQEIVHAWVEIKLKGVNFWIDGAGISTQEAYTAAHKAHSVVKYTVNKAWLNLGKFDHYGPFAEHLLALDKANGIVHHNGQKAKAKNRKRSRNRK